MSAVTEDEIRSLAKLARLALTDEEVHSLQADLTSILSHMQALSEVNTDGVEPMTHAMAGQPSLRADIPGESLDRDLVLAASPRHDGESFAVPAILPSGS